MKYGFLFALLLMLLAGCGGNLVGEQVTYDEGAISVCGVGERLQPCRDVDGETYNQQLEYVPPARENEAMAGEAEKVRAESPEELQETISEMERNPQDD